MSKTIMPIISTPNGGCQQINCTMVVQKLLTRACDSDSLISKEDGI
jgi:hypothetical protein